MSDDKYNGWSNRETWAAALWINNEEGSYREARRLTRRAVADATDTDDEDNETIDKDAAAEALASELESVFTPDHDLGGLAGDLLTHAAGRIDWLDIAEHMIADEV